MSEIFQNEIERLHKVIECRTRENRMLLDQVDRMADYERRLEEELQVLKGAKNG